MKRSWIGFILLIALLLGCLLVTKRMVDIHEPIESRLLQSAQTAMDGNWQQAEDLFHHAETDWKKKAHFRGCFADHNPVEEVDAAFALQEAGLNLLLCGSYCIIKIGFVDSLFYQFGKRFDHGRLVFLVSDAEP